MDEDDDLRPRLWPLHPRPHKNEPLDRWVRRLAAAYGVTYSDFCRYALGIPKAQHHLLLTRPPDPVLAILEAGTGIPAGELRQMTATAILERCLRHFEQTLVNREPKWSEWLMSQGKGRIWLHHEHAISRRRMQSLREQQDQRHREAREEFAAFLAARDGN